MAKNILIFSDGTGQAGGLKFDEDRSNIFKLYRATRVGPDSSINPTEQVAFYDPGLGSQADGSNLWGKGLLRSIYNLVSQATGFGITANIIDCYSAIIRLYEDGDRIFIFGFSRGAYTARCISGVLAYCGVPTSLPNGALLKRDVGSSQALAAYAVKHVYQFTESRPKAQRNAHQRFLHDTRDILAKDFRIRHQSCDPSNPEKANVYPYLIGVFDTVAALGNLKKTALFVAAFLLFAAAVSFLISLLPLLFDEMPSYLSFRNSLSVIVGATIALTVVIYFYTHIKFDFRVPGYGIWKRLKTLHVTSTWQKFYDTSLNPNVLYAKHAISIDENRSDFKRVEWGSFDPNRSARDAFDNPWFEQVWFPGCHSDVGGSYRENEARLSDGAMKWMLQCASIIPNGIKYDSSVLKIYPDSGGMQHDERKAGLGFVTRLFKLNWGKQDRVLPRRKDEQQSRATMHKSVYQRFDLEEVLQHDSKSPYRPEPLKSHIDFSGGWNADGKSQPRPSKTRLAIAEDTEAKYENKLREQTKAEKTR